MGLRERAQHAWDWLRTPQPPTAGLLVCALLAGLVGLGAGFAEKWPCFTPWEDGSQYRDHCYNDIMPLYGARGFPDHEMPYVRYEAPPPGGAINDQPGFNEYPVLTGLAQWAASYGAHDGDSFFVANLPALALATLLGAAFLAYARLPPIWTLGWVLLPPMAFYAFNNWDLLAVGLATAGLVAHLRGRPLTSGILLALGASAKFYPALFLVLVGLDLLRQERGLRRAGWRFGLAAVATLAIMHGPFIAVNWQGWWATYDFHLHRGPTFETPWLVLAHWRETPGGPSDQLFLSTVPKAAAKLFVVAFVAIGALVVLGRLAWQHACLAATALFLVLNTVQSVQYALWLLPLLALARMPLWVTAAYVAADAAVFFTIWRFFYDLDHGGDPWGPFTAAVLARAAAQLLLAGVALWLGHGQRPQVPVPATPVQNRNPLPRPPST